MLPDPAINAQLISCQDCNLQLPVSSFYRGRKTRCKSCQNKRDKERKSSRTYPRTTGITLCQSCRLPLPPEQFHTDKHRKNGLRAYCKSCCSILGKSKWNSYDSMLEWRRANPEKVKAYNKKNYGPKSIASTIRWRKRNKQKCKEASKRYRDKKKALKKAQEV